MELTHDEVADLLGAGSAAPSSHDSKPWHLSWVAGAVEVRGDPDRLLAVADPDARELRLSCGAAVANVSLAVRVQGRRAHTTLLPDAADPWFFARVRPGSDWPARSWEREIAVGIHRRPVGRHPLRPLPLSPSVREDLVRAVERAGCWLVYVDGPVGTRRIRDATIAARRRQGADPAFLRERRRWIGECGSPVGTLPPDQDDVPVVAVVATLQDGPRAQLQAGWAAEEVLLTAAARGVTTTVVASPLEVPDLREEVRAVLGGGLWPQVVLRLRDGEPPAAVAGGLRALSE